MTARRGLVVGVLDTRAMMQKIMQHTGNLGKIIVIMWFQLGTFGCLCSNISESPLLLIRLRYPKRD